MTSEILSVNILDRNYKIKCNANETEILKEASKMLSESIHETQKNSSLSFLDSIILSSLNLCGKQIALQQASDLAASSMTTFSNEQLESIERIDEKVRSALYSNATPRC